MKKLIPAGLLAVALIAGGVLLLMSGKDAVTLAYAQKSGLLAADTVNVSFQGVAGKVVSVEVAEEQQVKEGDVLMSLDATDLDLQIERLTLDLQQQEIRIWQAQAQAGFTEEVKRQAQLNNEEDVARQLLVIEAAQNTLALAQINFERIETLFNAGVVPQADFDATSFQLDTATNNLSQQQAALEKIRVNQPNVDTSNVYNVDSLQKQKESLEVQLQTLEEQKSRLVLQAPSDGKIIRLIPKVGENIPLGSVVAVLEANQLYFDVYVGETQVAPYQTGAKVLCRVPALQTDVAGTVSYVTSAPTYASMRMSREKGQADVSSFRVRVNVERIDGLLPGMTVEVSGDDPILR